MQTTGLSAPRAAMSTGMGTPTPTLQVNLSLWLNAGVPATEVARRAGHGIAVLLKVYANCIDGQAGAANGRISDALDEDGSEGT